MFQRIFSWIETYERHLSALAMLAGFIADNIFFGRVDLWQTQAVFAVYTVACFLSIPLSLWVESRVFRGYPRARWYSMFPLITQFALGGFWSGFVIFYGRSAYLGASWPFLALLFLVFLGSEYFHRYHARLVFTSILFFFALYSYMIFAVPVYTRTIGTLTFIGSGIAAIALFAVFTWLLRLLARDRFLIALLRIRLGVLVVLVLMNVFYFTNILPPLPLSVEAAGIYHSVWRVSGGYLAITESQSWRVRYLGSPAILRLARGANLSAYSSVFAPTTLYTTIVHRWQWYDPVAGTWVTKAAIAYPIAGGRDGGYRGYSTLAIADEGQWRVRVETSDGRLMTQMFFTAEMVGVTPSVTTITLQ